MADNLSTNQTEFNDRFYILSKKERNLTYILPKIKAQNNIFKHCHVYLSLGRHQMTLCTNLFSVSIIYCGFIQLIQKTTQMRIYPTYTENNTNSETRTMRMRMHFLHCCNWVITINQKLNETYGINHTVQSNNILCLSNCLPCN